MASTLTTRYASEEQKTLAETLSGIDMSQQAKESILKALHGDGGKAPLLRQDLQQSKLLSMKAMDECAKNWPRHVHRFASYCCRCLQHGLYKMTKKSKVAVIPNLRASELAQAAKLMTYVTADMEDVSLVICLFEE